MIARPASHWIERLGLARHPEGGFYRETYRAREGSPRNHSTAIYYLLPAEEVSRLHRLRSDELFHFYTGSPLVVHVIDSQGGYHKLVLGDGEADGFQAVVPAGSWFGATVEDPGSYALVGCTVAPGFDFEDFETADRAELLGRHPEHGAIIRRLTP